MADDNSRLSLIQRLCIETAKSGSIAAFIEVFRYTHMEQPLGRNQPSSTEDLIAAAGAQSAEVVDEFCFDNPLQFPPDQLRKFQETLEEVDMAGVSRDYVAKFDLLSQLSDSFSANQALRAKAKLHPLVTPYPVVTTVSADSDTLRSSDVLVLISSPQFRRNVDIADPLLAAVAKMRQIHIDTHVYPPLVVHYAILARNAFQDFLGGQERDSGLRGMLRDVLGVGHPASGGEPPIAPGCLSLKPPSETAVYVQSGANALCELAEVPDNIRIRMLLYAVTCYLRLGRALHQFQLHLPAHLALDICSRALDALEDQLHTDFSKDFQPTIENGLAVFVPDEGVAAAEAVGVTGTSSPAAGAEVAAAGIASAQLDSASVPDLPASILDGGSLPTFFPAPPERPDGGDAGVQGFYSEYTEGISEYAYAAHSLVVHNILCLASDVLGNSIDASSLAILEKDLRVCDRWIRNAVAGAHVATEPTKDSPPDGASSPPLDTPAPPSEPQSQGGPFPDHQPPLQAASCQLDADLNESDLAGASSPQEDAEDPLEKAPDGLSLPANMNYRMAVTALALYKLAADTAFQYHIFAMILPCSRRLFELSTRLGATPALRPYTDKLLELGGMFAVTAHLWLARWAALEGNTKRNIYHLSERWKLATEEMSTTVQRFHEVMAEVEAEDTDSEGVSAPQGEEALPGGQERDAGQAASAPDDAADEREEGMKGDAAEPPEGQGALLTRSRAAGLTLNTLADSATPLSATVESPGSAPTPKAFQSRGALSPRPSALRTQRLAGTDESALSNSVVGFAPRATPKGKALRLDVPSTPSSQEAAQLATTTRAMLTAREAVSAASALSFAYKAAHKDDESIKLISDAWKTAEDVLKDDSQIETKVRRAGARRTSRGTPGTPSALDAVVDRERQEISGVMVEARVRYGAIQGQVAAEQAMRAVAGQGTLEVGEGEDDLDDFLPDASPEA